MQEKLTRKGILEFSLPEENCSFKIAVYSMDYAIVWNDLKNRLRYILKYEDWHSEEYYKACAEIQQIIFNLDNDYQLPELE